jgi:hypothetical protein
MNETRVPTNSRTKDSSGIRYEAPLLVELGNLAELTSYTVSIRV